MKEKKTVHEKANDRKLEAYVSLCRGYTATEIALELSEKYDVTERTAWNYIKGGNDLLEGIKAKIKVDVEFGLAYQRLNTLYLKQFEICDYKGALATQKEIIALTGIAEAQKIDITSQGKELLGNVTINIARKEADKDTFAGSEKEVDTSRKKKK